MSDSPFPVLEPFFVFLIFVQVLAEFAKCLMALETTSIFSFLAQKLLLFSSPDT